jgi:hypothetical protein
MDALVIEGVRLLRAESVATIPAVADTYADARAGVQGPDAILQKSVRNLQTGATVLS